VSPDGPASRRQIEDTTAARLAEIVAAAEQAAKGVIDEAEAEARERLAEATAEADRIVAERLDRLVGLTEDLDRQAEALKRGAEALRAALAEARAEVGEGAESFGGSRMMRDPEVRDGEREPRHEPDRGRRDVDDESRRDDDREAPRPAGPSLTVVGAPDPRDVEPFNGRFSPPAPPTDTDAAPNGTHDLASPDPDPEPASTSTPAGARLLATQMAVSGSSREEIEQRLRSGFQIADTTAILDAILGPER
jgi:vacuolar-type H+-ATPase subunit H